MNTTARAPWLSSDKWICLSVPQIHRERHAVTDWQKTRKGNSLTLTWLWTLRVSTEHVEGVAERGNLHFTGS